MIKKITKSSALFLTMASANDAMKPMEFFEVAAHPVVKDETIDWVLGVTGFLVGGGIEAGANLGGI